MAQETPLLDVSTAQQRLLAHFRPLESVVIPLIDATGRVLAETIAAPISLPPFDNSAMDGFALRAQDTARASSDRPSEHRVVVDIPAGSSDTLNLRPGEAARIMTGAPMPEGADAVIPVEDTDFHSRQAGIQPPPVVKVFRAISPGTNVRFRGDDIRAGDQVMSTGHRIRPQDAGLLSMLGVAKLQVRRKPRIAIFSSGDELLPVEVPLEPGKIHDANMYTLIGEAYKSGADPVNLGIVPDRPEDVRAVLRKAVDERVDLILSSAGVSVGAMDFVRSVIEQEGRLEFWRVNMRPGKPMAFGYYLDTPFIGLPGNPVSAFVGFEVFVRPTILKMQGIELQTRNAIKVRLGEGIQSDGRESYLRAVVSNAEDGFVAHLTGHQGSGNLHSLVQANALLLIPSGVKSLPFGAQVEAWLLEGFG